MNIDPELKEHLMSLLQETHDNFNSDRIEDYRLVINAIFNNIMEFNESDPDMNEIIAKILEKAYTLSKYKEEVKYDAEAYFLPLSIRGHFKGRKLNDKFNPL